MAASLEYTAGKQLTAGDKSIKHQVHNYFWTLRDTKFANFTSNHIEKSLI